MKKIDELENIIREAESRAHEVWYNRDEILAKAAAEAELIIYTMDDSCDPRYIACLAKLESWKEEPHYVCC